VGAPSIADFAKGGYSTVDTIGIVPFNAGVESQPSAALAIASTVGLASRRLELAASSLSVIRTVVICAVALALGFLIHARGGLN